MLIGFIIWALTKTVFPHLAGSTFSIIVFTIIIISAVGMMGGKGIGSGGVSFFTGVFAGTFGALARFAFRSVRFIFIGVQEAVATRLIRPTNHPDRELPVWTYVVRRETARSSPAAGGGAQAPSTCSVRMRGVHQGAVPTEGNRVSFEGVVNSKTNVFEATTGFIEGKHSRERIMVEIPRSR